MGQCRNLRAAAVDLAEKCFHHRQHPQRGRACPIEVDRVSRPVARARPPDALRSGIARLRPVFAAGQGIEPPHRLAAHANRCPVRVRRTSRLLKGYVTKITDRTAAQTAAPVMSTQRAGALFGMRKITPTTVVSCVTGGGQFIRPGWFSGRSALVRSPSSAWPGAVRSRRDPATTVECNSRRPARRRAARHKFGRSRRCSCGQRGPAPQQWGRSGSG
jgi:hypothetical protein